MSRQNLGKPRIFLNVAEYLAVNGVIDIGSVFRTLPVVMETVTTVPNISTSGIDLTNPYIAILGYNGDAKITDGTNDITTTPIVGDMTTTGYVIAGISDDVSIITDATDNTISAGSVLLGTYYNFPTSPDLNLSLSYEYDGRTEITTRGGSTLSNLNYISPPNWGTLGAWEFEGGNANLARNGRRVWDISFSYMSDDKIFPTNLALTNDDADATDGSQNSITDTLLQEDTLQRVIHLTNGGQLPFIFQPDSANNQVFSIAKFDQQSFRFEQVANNVYNVSLKIREVW
jgi:hypothetical protein